MRAILNSLFIFIFVLLTPLFGILLTFRFGNLTAEAIKAGLQSYRIYDAVVTLINTKVDEALKETAKDDPSRRVTVAIKQQLTAEYLQTKTNTLIDDTAAWLNDRTSQPPVISVLDLKEKLMAQNAKLVDQLTAMQAEFDRQKPAIEKSLREQGDGETQAAYDQLKNLDVVQILKTDPTIPIGQRLGWLKTGYQLSHQWLPVIGLGLLGLLGGIFVINRPLAVRWRTVGITLMFAGAANLTLWISLFFASRVLLPKLLTQVVWPTLTAPLVKIFIEPIFAAYQKIGGIYTATLFGCMLICFWLASRYKTR